MIVLYKEGQIMVWRIDKLSIPPLPSSPSCSVESQKTRLQWKRLQVSVRIKGWRESYGYQGLARAWQASVKVSGDSGLGENAFEVLGACTRRLHLDEDFLAVPRDCGEVPD